MCRHRLELNSRSEKHQVWSVFGILWAHDATDVWVFVNKALQLWFFTGKGCFWGTFPFGTLPYFIPKRQLSLKICSLCCCLTVFAVPNLPLLCLIPYELNSQPSRGQPFNTNIWVLQLNFSSHRNTIALKAYLRFLMTLTYPLMLSKNSGAHPMGSMPCPAQTSTISGMDRTIPFDGI
jgi:hypothetical protein